MFDATSSSTTYATEKFTAQAINALISRWDPYRRWFTLLAEGGESNTGYYYICFECFGMIDLKATSGFNGYN